LTPRGRACDGIGAPASNRDVDLTSHPAQSLLTREIDRSQWPTRSEKGTLRPL